MFLVGVPAGDAFAHLHPLQRDPADDRTFDVTLPPLPAGTYDVYADVTQESGFPNTLTATVQVPPGAEAAAAASGPAVDPDDSWVLAAPAAGPGSTSDLGGGYTMTWTPAGAPSAAGRDGDLRFAVRGPGGRPAALEPYMGMLSHAAIRRDDGQVFVHLHPQGTISMASQQVFATKEARGAGMATSMPMPVATSNDGVLGFPYGFPKPGRYRIWVQVRTGGRVRTGVFEARIAPG
jgi:hypothetical protein